MGGTCPSCAPVKSPALESASPRYEAKHAGASAPASTNASRRASQASLQKIRKLYVGSQEVDVKRKSTLSRFSTRKVYLVRFLKGLNVRNHTIEQHNKRSKYGGKLPEQVATPTGWFQTKKIGNRWMFVDPEGHAFYSFGMCSVRRNRSKNGRVYLSQKFSNDDNWANQTNTLLRSMGVNCLGPWSDHGLLNSQKNKLPYTIMLNLVAGFGNSIHYTKPGGGHVDFKGNCIPVFHDKFEDFALKKARAVIGDACKDPYCVGFFSDNELPFRDDMLNLYLKLDINDPGNIEARRWMHEREYAPEKALEPEVQLQFVSHVAIQYFEICSRVIKKVAPNHLYLGSRFHGKAKKLVDLLKTAGKYVDVISVNWYDTWDPRVKGEFTNMWEIASGKPFLITEFYAKGADSKMPNRGGAGWVVKTQKDRGLFFEHFCLGLMEHPGCVGFHWFKYMDDDPTEKHKDPAKISNKGLLNHRYEKYGELHEAMKHFNLRGYSTLEFLSR